MTFTGIIIEESLADRTVLNNLTIISKQIEPVTESHKTPWVSQWTMDTVAIPTEKIEQVCEEISTSLDPDHNWYADFKSGTEHYIVYRKKVFHITDRRDVSQYNEATRYGISLGIPEYQVDFSPHVVEWKR